MEKYEQTSENGSGDGGGDIIREGSETVSETYKNLQQKLLCIIKYQLMDKQVG